MRPPFSFWSCPKRECAAPGGREKGAWRASVQWPSARDGGRRIGACSDFAWPSGTLWPSARSILPSRGGWCGGRRGARTHLSCFSFRAFRFATRCPGGRGGVRPKARAAMTARAARSEAERAERGAGQMRPCTPTTWAPSATGRQYRPCRRPKRARRPGKIGAGTDTPTPVRAEGHCTGARPALFSLDRARPVSLLARQKRNGGCILAGQAPPAGADTTVAAVRRPLHACVHRPLPPSSGRSASDPWVA